MKKILKSFILIGCFLFLGLTFNQTTSQAGCYYKQKLSVRKGSPSATYKSQDVWFYSSDIRDAIEKADNNSTVYVQNTSESGSKNLSGQLYINKGLNIYGISSIAWDGSGNNYYDINGNYKYWGYTGVKNITVYSGALQNGMPEIDIVSGNPKKTYSEKLDTSSSAYQNVYGGGLILKSNINISGIKISGLCGSRNNACSLITILNGTCNLSNVWLADNNWYTYKGRKANDNITAATEQKTGIGNPGGGLTIYGSTAQCTIRNKVTISNCHSYFQGGGIHVSQGGTLYNADGSNFIIKDCSASSGGAMFAYDSGRIILWAASNATCDIVGNYVDLDAYDAYSTVSNLGYTAGSIHIAKDGFCRIGCAGGIYKIYNGGSETQYTYARGGTPDAGNIAVKGELVTDHTTYLYDGTGSRASQIIISSTGKWTYGNNGTTTVIGNADNGYSKENVYQPYPLCGAVKNFNSSSACLVIYNNGGHVEENGNLKIKTQLNTNSANPWRIIYNDGDNGTFFFRGEISRNDSYVSNPDLYAIENYAGIQLTNASILKGAGKINNRGKLYTQNTVKAYTGVENQKNAQAFIQGTFDLNTNSYYNYGMTKFGDVDNDTTKVLKAKIYSYGDGTEYAASSPNAGNNYQTYYTQNYQNGSIIFDNNITSQSLLRIYSGYVCFNHKGQFNNIGTVVVSDGGSLHLDGDNVVFEAPVTVDGSSANLHISKYKTGEIFSKKISNSSGSVELDNIGKVDTITSNGYVRINAAQNEVYNLYNYGNGKIFQSYGYVGTIINGKDETDSNSVISKKATYYQSGGRIGSAGSTKALINYGIFHMGDTACGKNTKGTAYGAVSNAGTMYIGSGTVFNQKSVIGSLDTRSNFQNTGKLYNHNGEIYVTNFGNLGSGVVQNQTEAGMNVNTLIDVSDTFTNQATLESYSGTIKGKVQNQFGTALIRGTTVIGAINNDGGILTIANGIKSGQATVIGQIENKKNPIKSGEINIVNETVNGTLDLDWSKIENESGTKMTLNCFDLYNPSAAPTNFKTLTINGLSVNCNTYLDIGSSVSITRLLNMGNIKILGKDKKTNGISSSNIQTLYNKASIISEKGGILGINFVDNTGNAAFNGAIKSTSETNISNTGDMSLSDSYLGYLGVINSTGNLTIGNGFTFDRNTYSVCVSGGQTDLGDCEFRQAGNAIMIAGNGHIAFGEKTKLNAKYVILTLTEDGIKSAPITDNTKGGTKYWLGFRDNKHATDELVKALKVPLVKFGHTYSWKTKVQALLGMKKDSRGDERYDIYTHAEKEELPNNNTAYLHLNDVTPPEINFSKEAGKFIEVDCRYGSHTTDYFPITFTDDISGIKKITVKVTNLDMKNAGLKNYVFTQEIDIPDKKLAYDLPTTIKLHDDDTPITFGNLQINVSATDNTGNVAKVSKCITAGRIMVEIADKFTDSKKLSGNSKDYWNFIKSNDDEYIDNIGPWAAGDQKWIKVTLEGFWDKLNISYVNEQGELDLNKKSFKGNTIAKNNYKTINGDVNGTQKIIEVPLKAKKKDYNFTGKISIQKDCASNGVDKKTFTFNFNTAKRKTIENSIKKRIILQS